MIMSSHRVATADSILAMPQAAAHAPRTAACSSPAAAMFAASCLCLQLLPSGFCAQSGVMAEWLWHCSLWHSAWTRICTCMASANLKPTVGPGSTQKVTKFDSAEKLVVEIFIAGDGTHYPRKGQTVDVHYTAYVSPQCLVATNPFGSTMLLSWNRAKHGTSNTIHDRC